ncbi:MAG: LCP family protein, partial [Patescibacteria group bacterium]
SVFAYQLIPTSQTEIITTNNKNADVLKSVFSSSATNNLVDKDKNRDKKEINILALGRPGQGYSGGNLTDTIILINLNPTNNKAILISLPRDLLVENQKYGYSTKINSVYNSEGIEALKEKVTEITGLPIDKHIIVDLVVVKEIITSIDGLNVFVPQDINDLFFPGPNHTYDSFKIKAGWRYLDGETALKYIRTRYTSPNGDFDRMARQQQIINLLKQKVLALNPLWDFPTYLKIFNTLNRHIETDLGIMEIKDLWQTTKDIEIDNIVNLVIDKKETELLMGGQVLFGEQMASVVYPKAGKENYEEIKKYIQEKINKN